MRARTLAITIVAGLALTACGTERSAEAFCQTLYEQKIQYLETYDASQLNGLSEGDQLLGGIGLALGATGEIPGIYRKLAEVAPGQIQQDAETVANGFERMFGAAGGAASDPLSAAFGGLLAGAQMSGPLSRVENYAADNCTADGGVK